VSRSERSFLPVLSVASMTTYLAGVICFIYALTLKAQANSGQAGPEAGFFYGADTFSLFSILLQAAFGCRVGIIISKIKREGDGLLYRHLQQRRHRLKSISYSDITQSQLGGANRQPNGFSSESAISVDGLTGCNWVGFCLSLVSKLAVFSYCLYLDFYALEDPSKHHQNETENIILLLGSVFSIVVEAAMYMKLYKGQKKAKIQLADVAQQTQALSKESESTPYGAV
jgi:hypothetical protein